MSRTLEIIGVPEELHDALTARARQEGVSVSELILRELEKQVVPGIEPEELLSRLQRLPRVDMGGLTAADLVREGREERVNRIIDAVARR